MGIFSRLSDILNANITSILDKAEDPEKMARLMLQEMEETLVEVRSDAARLIADKKESERRIENLEDQIKDWTNKATLALKHNREDLARQALAEKQKLLTHLEEKQAFQEEMEAQLGKYDEDIARLQSTMKEARKRLDSIRLRKQVSQNRLKVHEQTREDKRIRHEARFEQMERDLDALDSKLEADGLGLASLNDELAALEITASVDAELEALKAGIAQEQSEKEKA
ncbi:PspA/IM30 family protein [Parendozoicomonas haliclonae]|uniref:Phage shock protein A n=1 Tax=Parendozoicomonas haliclonae TaxID=1960125 RepID=A0A1X7AI94_9GAMM|nr:PspA/IM30 family protein [Parendozoicomonas haliclonae]SMA44078.1 Phage shock protein A [Parendozoicomonas haliclonae]